MIKFLLLFISLCTSIAFSAEEGRHDGINLCTVRAYNYEGISFSDSHPGPINANKAACEEMRPAVNAKKIGVEYRDNNTKLMDLIEVVLSEKACLSLHEILRKYKDNLVQQRLQFDQEAQKRLLLFKKYADFIDMQRQYAHSAAFQATCSAEEHRQAVYLDLDFINEINSSGAETQVQTSGELMEDCSNVTAYGQEDLNSFKVSMKKSKKSEFTIFHDVYGVPDQVIVKNSSGTVLYDSGCNPGDNKVQISNDRLGSDLIAYVSVVLNCRDRGQKGSAWELALSCGPKAPLCPYLDQLDQLAKKEVENTKKLIDIHVLERSCYEHYDEDVLSSLVKGNLIVVDPTWEFNGRCLTSDKICLQKRKERIKQEEDLLQKNKDLMKGAKARFSSSDLSDEEKKKIAAKLLASEEEKKGELLKEKVKDNIDGEKTDDQVLRRELAGEIDFTPNSEKDRRNCFKKPGEFDSLFRKVSWSYCAVGFRRLGLYDEGRSSFKDLPIK